jgi:hypothetical protein
MNKKFTDMLKRPSGNEGAVQTKKSFTDSAKKNQSFTSNAVNELIHFITGKDSVNGLDACYYLMVEREKLEKFRRDVKIMQTINLLDYGKIVASCYGKTPNERVRKIMKEEYSVDLNEDGTAV